jgi:selenophosphate synthase
MRNIMCKCENLLNHGGFGTACIDYLSNIMLRSYRKFSKNFHNLIVGKGHTIKGAKSQNEELILFDFIKQDHGTQVGYTVANNDTIQIIDPTEKLSSPTQIYPALNNALNDVILFGAIDNLKLHPIFDSPNEKIKGEMKSEIMNYANEFKIDLIGLEPLNIGSSLIGSTVFGELYKEPPIFYTDLESGDKILVHRSFGDLAPINAYIYNKILCENGFSKRELKFASDKIISVLKKPNLEIGKIINKYCPNFGEKLDRNKHILITKDISGEGLSIFKELAEKSKKDIHITDIPLFFDEITKAAVKNLLIRDGTIGTNGAIVMIASENVINQIKNDLNSKGFNPHIMGFIGNGCSNKVHAPEIIKDLIYSERLNNFNIK